MAEGYARVTGKPGVLIVTSGPGATNVVTPLQDALMDGTPLVVFTGQVPTAVATVKVVPGVLLRGALVSEKRAASVP